MWITPHDLPACDETDLKGDCNSRRLVLRDVGRTEEAEGHEVLEVFELELPWGQGLVGSGGGKMCFTTI